MNATHAPADLRYFLTYSGVKLPLSLTEPLQPEALANRNTYFRASYDPQGCMLWVEKLVYGEVELRHDYVWSQDGKLVSATIAVPDEEARTLHFDGPQA